MTVHTQAVNFNAKQDLYDFVESKLNKLTNYYDRILSAKVYLKVENTSEKENKLIEVLLEVPGDDIIVKKHGQSFEECVDVAADTLKKLIVRKKEKEMVR